MSLARTTEQARLASSAVVRVEWADSPIGIAGAGATTALGVKTAKIKTRRQRTMTVAGVPTGAVVLLRLRAKPMHGATVLRVLPLPRGVERMNFAVVPVQVRE